MCKKLLFLGFILLFVAGFAVAQDEYPILWEDHFEDDDPPALHNVGWIYYPEGDIAGQIVEQQDGALFIEAGSYGGLAGVGLVETNGLPHIELDEDGNITDATIDSSLQNKWSDPNQILTFQVNFARFTTSFFIVSTRMPMDSSRGDADPTEAPGYALFISPLEGVVRVAHYEGPTAALAPDTWTYYGENTFEFELEVFYWVKWYLNEGVLKVKIWEGFPEDEPDEWLIETADPEPRVNGKFTMFGLLGAPPAPGEGDRIYLDDIVMRSSNPGGIDVASKDIAAIPNDFQLNQNYPNPFNPNTTISFHLSEKNVTKLVVYNTTGQVIRTLLNSEMPAGSHTVSWDGLDENSNPVTSGIYLYRLTSGDHTVSKRMVLLK